MSSVLRYRDPDTGEWQELIVGGGGGGGDFVRRTGDTMTGPLLIDGAPLLLNREGAPIRGVGNYPQGLAAVNEDESALVPLRVGNAEVPDQAIPVGQADGRYLTPAAATAQFVDAAGDGMSGNLTINTHAGLTLHSPGEAVVGLGAILYGGRHGMRVVDGWAGNSGALSPLQIGEPIDANSAATVRWTDAGYAPRSHGGHIGAGGTGVATTDAGGTLAIGYGSGGVPTTANGDWWAMQRAPHIASWSGGVMWITNLNAHGAARINWIAT